MEKLNSIISSYQQKICKHDRQLWEQSYEKELFQRLHSVPRRVAKINTSLIDVDLFRGSAFSVSKSQTGWLSVATVAWFRLVFFPLYYRWWLCSTCSSVFALLCVLYVFQVGSLVICYTDSKQSQSSETLTVADYVTPYIMMYVLTVVHSHITANYSIPIRHFTFTGNNKRAKLSQKSHVKQSQSLTSPEKFERPRNKHVVCDCSKPSQDERNLARSFQPERNQLLVSGASSYSLPCSESSEKISASKILQRTEDWIGSKSFGCVPEWLSKGISETKSCQNFQSERGSDLEFLNLDRTVSDLAKTSEGDGWQSENIRSSRESVAAKSSLCSSVTAGSVLTVVGSSFEEMTIAEENIDQGVAPTPQPTLDANPLSIPVQNDLSKESASEGQTVGGATKAHRTFETQTDFSHSCYLLSALESKFEERSSDVLSIADSNTSMSDTCNSSFVSSADEDDEEKAGANNSADQNPSADDNSKPYISEFIRNAPCGVRQRRKASCRTASMLSSDKGSPCKTFDSGSYQGNASGFADKQKRGLEAMEVAAAAAAIASSDEDESHVTSCTKPRGQMMRQTAMRKSGAGRRRKSGSTDVLLDQKIAADKVSDSQGFVGRRRIPQCDSDGSDKKTTQSLPFLKKVKLSECEEEMVKMKLLLSRTSGLNCSADRKLQAAKNATVNSTESATTGLGSSSLINCLSSNTDKVSCMIWSPGGAVHKVDLTIMDIGWTIVRAVDCQQERCDYMVLGLLMSFLNMCTPSAYRLYHNLERENQTTTCTHANATQLLTASYASLILGHDFGQMAVLINGLMQRLCLSLLFFFLLSVAERTFKQRLLYAKYFCYLTSSRKAKKYDLPHFRLNKVRNIKTWLSLRSFLKKRGPQRSVESVVSTAFILAVILVSILCIELLQDYGHFLEHLGNWELVLWSMILGVYLLRFITLGTKINKKYRNLSVLITEQINLYLHMEQKPHKKEALMVANSVLKLAEDLLKELESPFKISGLSANPFLYNITKVVILSAFSAVLTELLGFKLKLYKIKIRS